MEQTRHFPCDIAIVGMGCIFPNACNLKEYWQLLFNGIDAIRDIPEHTHWRLKDYFHPDPACPDHTYCRRGGFLPETAFDPVSFGIPPNNLEATDTSQLLALEVTRMALEDAGYSKGHPDLSEKKVNVILGVTGTQELVIPLGARLGHPFWRQALTDAGIDDDKKEWIIDRIQASYAQWQENSFPGLLGNVVAGRIANRFNLSGTNAVSDAACASSLSAIHSAIMELVTHKCDMSITGGVDTLNDIFMHMCFSKTGVLSHTSDAKPFSRDADGTVLGEGIGMLVLKRLADAQKDGNRIYAVIKGMGTSSDGRTSAIYAPEAGGQIKALEAAYRESGIDPATVGLVEAHGTGTRVGDKVEFTALKSYFNGSCEKNRIAIGSVKSMIGHTKAAAGAAGIIKTALALYHKVIPPTLKAEIPDPELDINNSAFYLNNRSKPWINGETLSHPRRSGISAFGFGGSNFHAVLEEHEPKKSHVSWDGSVQIVAFSGPDTATLGHQLKAFSEIVMPDSPRDKGEQALVLAWQAGESRQRFSHADPSRLLLMVEPDTDLPALIKEAGEILKKGDPATGPVFFGKGSPGGKLGFLFPGQGSQYPHMGKDLFALFPEANDALAQAGSTFTRQWEKTDSKQLTAYMFPPPDHVQDKKAAEDALRQTWVAQPAIGAVSLAYTDILARFGIRPDVTCGHSFGELPALYAAGWLDRHTLMALASARGKFMAQAGKKGPEAGSMLAVQAPLADIEALVKNENLDLVLANKNSRTQGVLSGRTEEIHRARKLCKQQKMRAVKLPVAAAFHSSLVADAAKPFETFLKAYPVAPTQTPVMSNTLGTLYPADPGKVFSVLGNQLMHPVNFTDNIQAMHREKVSFFLEAGPKTVLTGLVKQILKGRDITAVSLDGSAGRNKGLADLAEVLCRVAAQGFTVDLTQWEEPVPEPAPKKMRVWLSGANPKPGTNAPKGGAPLPETAPAPQTAAQKPEPVHPPKKAAAPGQAIHRQQPEKQAPAPNRTGTKGSDMSQPSDTQPNPNGTPAREAMHLIQKGLEAMQHLQAQTARAHEKFLETQAQASKTLAGMMTQTRNFTATMPDPINGSAAPEQNSPWPPLSAPEPPGPNRLNHRRMKPPSPPN